jgi:hypothetical protein
MTLLSPTNCFTHCHTLQESLAERLEEVLYCHAFRGAPTLTVLHIPLGNFLAHCRKLNPSHPCRDSFKGDYGIAQTLAKSGTPHHGPLEDRHHTMSSGYPICSEQRSLTSPSCRLPGGRPHRPVSSLVPSSREPLSLPETPARPHRIFYDARPRPQHARISGPENEQEIPSNALISSPVHNFVTLTVKI